jgi:hypothetical protein
VPRWIDVPPELAEAAIKRDLQACNHATFKLYRLNNEEQSILGVDSNRNQGMTRSVQMLIYNYFVASVV